MFNVIISVRSDDSELPKKIEFYPEKKACVCIMHFRKLYIINMRY